jgi:NADH:ubiquinone oxidoreductase subunit F (NADH-binding)
VPSDPLVPVFRRGVDGRPTLVLNAETLAQVALLARHGAGWFRSLGTPSDPGTFLVTVSATAPATLTHPGVIEIPRGTPLRSVLHSAGAHLDRVAGVLVGGYHGAWVPVSADVLLTVDDLARFGASPGAGVLHVLDQDTCPLAFAAEVAGYLAGQSARQCGPCVNGLPRVASALQRLAVPGGTTDLPAEVQRLLGLVDRRGACAHPDGTARFVASTVQVFAGHVQHHLEGACDAGAR